MKGYGNISWISLPFILYGFYLICTRLRSPAHRVIFISLIASPLGAAAAQISVLRTIWMIIPITIITAYGLTTLLEKLESKRISYLMLSVSLCLILSGINLYMWRDAVVNGPRWYSDYGLYGLQYGAQQVFGDVIPKLLDENPSSQVVVTPTWANGTDNFMRFFLTPEQQRRVRLDSVNAYLDEKQPVDRNLDLILTKPEYEQAANSPKFQNIRIKQIINYPDGSPGFYVLNLEYSDIADEIFAGEKLVRSQPLDGEVVIDGQPVKIRYSRIDMGQPQAMFDGDVHTLMRGLEANPLVIELYFPSPRPIRHLAADFANMDFDLSVELFEQTGGSPVVYDLSVRNPEGDPHIDMTFDKGPDQVSMARLIIHHVTAGEKAHIHVRELNFSP
jgi:hypothetical protein